MDIKGSLRQRINKERAEQLIAVKQEADSAEQDRHQRQVITRREHEKFELLKKPHNQLHEMIAADSQAKLSEAHNTSGHALIKKRYPLDNSYCGQSGALTVDTYYLNDFPSKVFHLGLVVTESNNNTPTTHYIATVLLPFGRNDNEPFDRGIRFLEPKLRSQFDLPQTRTAGQALSDSEADEVAKLINEAYEIRFSRPY